MTKQDLLQHCIRGDMGSILWEGGGNMWSKIGKISFNTTQN